MPYDELRETAIAVHDRQRELPKAAQRALIDGLCDRLQGRGVCLDAGVGSGSIALPLAHVGAPIVGVDVSTAMLNALRAKSGGIAPFPLVRADLTLLPFRRGSFGAAIAANVFHLIDAWRVAVDELVRVVRPGGLLLVNLGVGGPVAGSGGRVQTTFRRLLGDAWPADRAPVGPRDAAEFESYLVESHMEPLSPFVIRFQQTFTLDDVIARLEHNVFARPADIDPAALRRAAIETRDWTTQYIGPLREPHTVERAITYRVFQLP